VENRNLCFFKNSYLPAKKNIPANIRKGAKALARRDDIDDIPMLVFLNKVGNISPTNCVTTNTAVAMKNFPVMDETIPAVMCTETKEKVRYQHEELINKARMQQSSSMLSGMCIKTFRWIYGWHVKVLDKLFYPSLNFTKEPAGISGIKTSNHN